MNVIDTVLHKCSDEFVLFCFYHVVVFFFQFLGDLNLLQEKSDTNMPIYYANPFDAAGIHVEYIMICA